jgi:hypothetical protein
MIALLFAAALFADTAPKVDVALRAPQPAAQSLRTEATAGRS